MKEYPLLDVGMAFVWQVMDGPKEFVVLVSQHREISVVQDVHGVLHRVSALTLKYPAIKN